VARAGNASPTLRGLFSPFTANDPQLQVTIDRQRALALGLPLNEITNAMQVMLGSQYVNDFEFNNRAYRVYVQADQRFRSNPQALRELSPQLAGLTALKADDAKVAMARASNLVDAAETITGAAETILGLIVEQAPFKAEIERRRAEINAELEAEALAALKHKEAAARDRLLAVQASIRGEIDGATARLEDLRAELQALETEVYSVRSARAELRPDRTKSAATPRSRRSGCVVAAVCRGGVLSFMLEMNIDCRYICHPSGIGRAGQRPPHGAANLGFQRGRAR
jgi:hypothetical protein